MSGSWDKLMANFCPVIGLNGSDGTTPPPPPPPAPSFFQEGKSCIVSKVGDSGLSGNDHRQAEGKESCSFLIKKSQKPNY